MARSEELAAEHGPVSEEVLSEEQCTWVVAHHLRARRQQIGMSVGQLAARARMSKSMLSKVENGQNSLSLASLARLAAALDIPVTALFRGLSAEGDAVFTKAGTGPEVIRPGTRAGQSYERLGNLRGADACLEPLLVSLTEQREAFPLHQHGGLEVLYMLEGAMSYDYGTQRYYLEVGDTLQFEGDIPHGPIELLELPVRFVSIAVRDNR